MWVPLHQHSMYSLLDGLSKPSQIAKRCANLGYKAAAITDHGSIGATVQFYSECKQHNLKPILGVELYLSPQNCRVRSQDNRKLSHLVVLAKNLSGWRRLLSITSGSNHKEVFYYKPRVDLNTLATFCDGSLISFSGHPGSDLANVLFTDYKLGYNSKNKEEAASHLDPDHKKKAIKLAEHYQGIFGKGNFFIEIQLIDQNNSPATQLIAEILREVSTITGIECVATADSHYPTKDDATDQRVLLCSAFETTLQNVRNKLANNEDVTLAGFFKSNNYHIPTQEEMVVIHTESEIANSEKIADMCEEYNIFSNPKLPKFGDGNQDEALRQLCRDGWARKINGKIIKAEQSPYVERIKTELDVISEAGLSGYFLIVQDYIKWARNQGWIVGPGRGSAAGSLVSYLTDITQVDPLKYNLMFSRFYNKGRNKPGHIELPDIDCDFPADKKEFVIDYLRQKYGNANVCQMGTFSGMQGRGAMKDVFRAHGKDFDEMNRITANIPANDKISDQLQNMKEAGREPSSILWTLENDAKSLQEWCWINDDGKLDGPYSTLFAQAMRLEGIKRHTGKHASGVIVSSEAVSGLFPLMRDQSSDNLITGVEMEDVAKLGGVKLDILGLRLLDKFMLVRTLLKAGKS